MSPLDPPASGSDDASAAASEAPALHGTAPTLQAGGFSGTVELSFTLELPQARGLAPQLALVFSSRAGNGPFGLGMGIGLPAFSVRTSLGVPAYLGRDPLDYAGAGPLTRRATAGPGDDEGVAYLPQFESDFTLMVQRPNGDGTTSWKTVDRENRVSLFGTGANARIADPRDPTRIAEWLLEETRDSKGNRVRYTYKPDDRENLPAAVYELDRGPPAQRYIERIQWGNYIDAGGAEQAAFELVFDYGEYALDNLDRSGADPYAPVRSWATRADAWSSFRPGFELRTQRLCRNILLFHRFEPLGSAPALVRSWALEHAPSPVFATLTGLRETGWRRRPEDGSYEQLSLPAVALGYSRFDPPAAPAYREMQVDGQGSAFPGMTGTAALQIIDLEGLGLPGLLNAEGPAVYYHRPLGEGRYAAPEPLAEFPDLGMPEPPVLTLADLDGDGRYALVARTDTLSGYFQREDARWQPYRPFPNVPTPMPGVASIEAALSGTGRSDALLLGPGRATVFDGRGTEGWGDPHSTALPDGFPIAGEGGEAEVLTFADPFGDGLAHRVRIRDGSFEVWPSLGHGRFGDRIVLANAPRFDGSTQASRIFLANVSGGPGVDLIVARDDCIEVHVNEAGNAFSAPRRIALPGAVSDAAQLGFADIVGNGSVSIVYTRLQPSVAHFYFPLDGQAPPGVAADAAPRPWMLLHWDTRRGTETALAYGSSTGYALAAQQAGRPWLTRVPFAAEVVAGVCTTDHINQVRSRQAFDYANGYYDPAWREFRGFGYVARLESEESIAGFERLPGTSPSWTRSWYLVGDDREDQALQAAARAAYFADPGAFALAPAAFDARIAGADAGTVDQAWRALAGRLTREELYAADSDGHGGHPVPLTVTDHAWFVRLEQPAAGGHPASVFVHEHQTVNLNYDEVADDPATQHHFMLDVNAYGDVLRSCSVNYPRRATLDPDRIVYPEQTVVRGIVELSRVSAVTEPFRLLGAEFEVQGLQLGGLGLPPGGHFGWSEMRALADAALLQRIAYGEPFDPGQLQSRPYNWRRTCYWDEAQTQALPLGEISARALVHHRESAAFSDAWLAEVFGDKVDPGLLRDEGGYLPATPGYWWNPGTVTDYALPDAPQAFFMPWRMRYEAPAGSKPVDGLLVETELRYDAPYHLFTTGQRERISEAVWLETQVQPDYQSLAPALAVDANGTRRQYLYDPLGRALAASIFKPADGAWPRVGDGNLDEPAEFERRPGATFADVLARKAHYLQQATSYCHYDSLAWTERQQPCARITLTRQTHVSDLGADQTTLILAQVDYEDAQQGPLQSRREADADPLTGLPRWLVEGGKRFDAANLEVETFFAWSAPRPIFTAGGAAADGSPVPPTRHAYDPLRRLLRSDDPKGFFSCTRYTPWQTVRYDRDDTVREAAYYQRFMRDYPSDPTTAQRDEWEALTQAAGFYNTPRTDVFDNAGGQIRILHDNLGNVPPDAFEAIVAGSGVSSRMLWDDLHAQGYLVTRTEAPVGTWVTGRFRPYFAGFVLQLGPGFEAFAPGVTAMLKANGLTTFLQTDPQGRRRVAIDPRLYHDNIVGGSDHANFRYAYAMQKSTPARAIGVDAGTRWTLENIFGRPMRRWDAQRATIEHYDRLQRRLRTEIDDGTAAAPLLAEVLTWGETATDAARHNLCGQVHEYRDEAGLLVNADYSLQGALLASSRQLPLAYRTAPDWALPVALEDTVYRKEYRFDVQNRPVALVFPNGGAASLRYDLSGRLQQTRLRDSGGTWHEVTGAIDWNAAGQVERLGFGGGVEQTRRYEATTQRLLALGGSAPPPQGGGDRRALQSLDCTYDPVGNTTLVRDRSASLLFCHAQPEAENRRRYDAVYELCGATGIEHPGIVANTHVDGFKQSIFAALCPADPLQQVTLRSYEERYGYDDARNLVSLAHLAGDAGGSFERLQPVQSGSNRLANQRYDDNGNPLQIALAGEVKLGWSPRNQMVEAGPYSKSGPGTRSEWYGYDHGGMRVRRVIEDHDADGKLVRVQQQVFLGPTYQVDLVQDIAGGAAPAVRATRTRLASAQQLLAILDERIDGGSTAATQLRLQLGGVQGSVSVETDADGNPLSYEAYYPFGGTSVIAGPDEATVEPKHIRYSGKIADDGLGLYDYGARYFAPWQGRWLNPDPSGTVNGLNLFQFVLDDPTTLADPDGRVAQLNRTPGRNGRLPIIRIHVSGVLLDNSGGGYTPLQMRAFARRLERQIASSYRGAGATVRYQVSAKIRASNRIHPNDHVFRLVPVGRLPTFQQVAGPRYMPGQYRPGGTVGYAPGRALPGGQRERQRAVFIRHNVANNQPAAAGPFLGTGRTAGGQASLERTGAHELGHTLGLNHPPVPGAVGALPGNLMNQTSSPNAGLNITEAQVLHIEAEYNAGRLNGADQGIDPQVLPF